MSESENTPAGRGNPKPLDQVADDLRYHMDCCQNGEKLVSHRQLQEWRTSILAASPSPPTSDATGSSAPSPAAGATGVVPAGWRLVPEEPTEEMLAAGGDGIEGGTGFNSYNEGVSVQEAERAYRAMIAAAPEAPAPVTSAPGAEGGEDLAGLSARATQGKWGVEGGVITALPSHVGTGIAQECGMHDNWPNNRAFIVALVNAWRDGRLALVTPQHTGDAR